MSESIESVIIYKPIDLKALIDQPVRILSHNGLVPRNGVGYVIDGERVTLHLDYSTGEFWVEEPEPFKMIFAQEIEAYRFLPD